jgi:nucleoside-diphosphate-sugar epimerase
MLGVEMSDTRGSVLVLGANGHFGRAVTSAFAEAGWQVRTFVRRPNPRQVRGVEPVIGDARDAGAISQAAKGMAVVVNALNPPYTKWRKLARPLAANALAAAETNSALLMFPGNVYNYGRTLPPVLDELTPQFPDTSKAEIRIEIEQQLRAAAVRGVNSVVVRAGDFFGGPDRGSWFDLAIVKSLHKNKVIYPGPVDRVHAWAYLPDLANTFVRLAERRGQLLGACSYHFAGHSMTGSGLHQLLERITGRSLRLAGMPWRLIGLAAPLSPMLAAVLEMRYLWERPHVLDDTKLRNLLGSVPHRPAADALRQALADLDLKADR